jgi:hypothetical protein
VARMAHVGGYGFLTGPLSVISSKRRRSRQGTPQPPPFPGVQRSPRRGRPCPRRGSQCPRRGQPRPRGSCRCSQCPRRGAAAPSLRLAVPTSGTAVSSPESRPVGRGPTAPSAGVGVERRALVPGPTASSRRAPGLGLPGLRAWSERGQAGCTVADHCKGYPRPLLRWGPRSERRRGRPCPSRGSAEPRLEASCPRQVAPRCAVEQRPCLHALGSGRPCSRRSAAEPAPAWPLLRSA